MENRVTTTEAPPVQDIEIDGAALRELLSDLAVTADSEDGHPDLYGIVLHTAPGSRSSYPVLVATSTDRYIVAQGHVPVTATFPGAVFVPIPEVQAMIRHLGTSHSAAVIRVKGDLLTLRVVPCSQSAGYLDCTITVAVRTTGAFPRNIRKVLAEPGESPQAGPVHLMPAVLSKLVQIAQHREGMTVTAYGHDKGVLVQMGASYRAVAMPGAQRLASALAPIFDLPSAS